MRKISDKTWIMRYVASMMLIGIITKKSEEELLISALSAAVTWARNNKPKETDYDAE